MAVGIIESGLLTNIATAIRALSGKAETYTPAEMAAALTSIAAELDESLAAQDALIEQLGVAIRTAAVGTEASVLKTEEEVVLNEL